MFTLRMKTDNAAFADGNKGKEVGRILAYVAICLRNGDIAGKMCDVDDNAVGEWKLTD